MKNRSLRILFGLSMMLTVFTHQANADYIQTCVLKSNAKKGKGIEVKTRKTVNFDSTGTTLELSHPSDSNPEEVMKCTIVLSPYGYTITNTSTQSAEKNQNGLILKQINYNKQSQSVSCSCNDAKVYEHPDDGSTAQIEEASY